MPGDDEDVGNGHCENMAGVIISCFNFLKIVIKQYILGLPNIVMLFISITNSRIYVWEDSCT